MATLLRHHLVLDLYRCDVQPFKILDQPVCIQRRTKACVNIDQHRDIHRAADILHDLPQLKIADRIQIRLTRQREGNAGASEVGRRKTAFLHHLCRNAVIASRQLDKLLRFYQFPDNL